jgi:hypothetical protein
MKRIMTSVLLLLALCVTAFSQNASDFTVDADGVITKYTGFDTVVVIPSVIGGKNIKGIDSEAFLRADLTRVTIPEGVLKIGRSAFDGNKLTAITIPNSVTEIGESAFANNRLTSVTIPGSVKTIKNRAFIHNTALAKIVILEGVEKIEYMAFADTKCTSVSLPSTITSITSKGNSEDSFDISGKPSFTLAANITVSFAEIPVFYSYIANDRKAGTYAFNLPLVNKKADDYEYYETRYGAVLIRYTGDSTRVRIPATIGGVAVKALYGKNSSYSGFTGTFQNKKLVAVQIPEGITYIGPATFSSNELTSVTIPESVTYLSGFSFNELTSINIPNSVLYIDGGAFLRNELTSITIPNSVLYIGSNAFFGNELTSVTIPDSVTRIGESAFKNCTSLTSVTFEGTIASDKLGGYPDNIYEWYSPFDGDLREKYLARGIGTYTRSGNTWTKKK